MMELYTEVILFHSVWKKNEPKDFKLHEKEAVLDDCSLYGEFLHLCQAT